MLNVAH